MLAPDSSPSFPAAKSVSKSQVRTGCLTSALFHGFYAAVAPGAFHVAYVKPRFCFYTEVEQLSADACCIFSGTPHCSDSELESRLQPLPWDYWVILILNIICQRISEQVNTIFFYPAWKKQSPVHDRLLTWVDTFIGVLCCYNKSGKCNVLYNVY